MSSELNQHTYKIMPGVGKINNTDLLFFKKNIIISYVCTCAHDYKYPSETKWIHSP